ncbi:MAG: LacI family transcriptional regulator [Acidobacteriota bacterium]|nr:LacI family transcriptional regulator [Acidobacteriota bacterium]
MPDPKKGNSDGESGAGASQKPVRLKELAEHLDLSPAAVSIVLNRSPVADSIPQATQDRVFAAAKELGYRPDFLARSLRSRRTRSIGVLVPEISEGYAAGVSRGLEKHLLSEGYFYFIASHQSEPELLAEGLERLRERLVEGFILLAAQLKAPPPLPTVVVSGHRALEGVTNVVLDQDHAAHHALSHLADLGHERIAFFRGPSNNADADDRWRAIVDAAATLSLEVAPELSIQLEGLSYGEVFYREGYARAKELLARGQRFTALFAFDDIAAVGAMRAFFDAGLRVPEDISIVGFDDIESASFLNPSLTTVRQPLREMGEIAGRVLLERLGGGETPPQVVVKPELVVRDSTCPAP